MSRLDALLATAGSVVFSTRGQAEGDYLVPRGVVEELRQALQEYERATVTAGTPERRRRAHRELLDAARTYYRGWCQDEADDAGVDITGCADKQHRAAVDLRDAIAEVERSGGDA